MDTIDILMATYNGAGYIDKQIDSILKQSYSNIRLLICDDLSTDHTVDIINRYKQEHPNQITIIKTLHKLGANQCFSLLLTYAKSKYIMFSDQDDVWFENKVERSFKEMKKLEAQYGDDIPLLVHTNLAVVDDKLNPIHNSFWRYSNIYPSKNTLNRLLVQNIVTGCTVMINRAVATVAQPFPEAIIQHDWWLALVASSLGAIKHISAPLIYYRQHQSNSIGAKQFAFLDYCKCLTQESNYKLKNRDQARALKARVYEKLSKDQQKILDTYLEIDTLSFIPFLLTCMRYRFCFHGFRRNLGVFAKKVVNKCR